MGQGVLGSFEEMVLVSAVRLADEATGTAIRRDLTRRCGYEVNIGAVHATLSRLEQKGLVRTRGTLKRPGPGRPPVRYEVLPEGRDELEATRSVRESVWDGLELGSEG